MSRLRTETDLCTQGKDECESMQLQRYRTTVRKRGYLRQKTQKGGRRKGPEGPSKKMSRHGETAEPFLHTTQLSK